MRRAEALVVRRMTNVVTRPVRTAMIARRITPDNPGLSDDVRFPVAMRSRRLGEFFLQYVFYELFGRTITGLLACSSTRRHRSEFSLMDLAMSVDRSSFHFGRGRQSEFLEDGHCEVFQSRVRQLGFLLVTRIPGTASAAMQ